MATNSVPASGPNIGVSRLLSNGLQQAVDSLTTQVNKLSSSMSHLTSGFANMTGAANRASGVGGGNFGLSWNSNSNSNNYQSVGGNWRFSLGGFGGFGGSGRVNGGGGNFGPLVPRSRLAFGLAATSGVLSAFTGYANRNMSSNMQMDYFGMQSAIAGGFTGDIQDTARLSRALAFNNNYAALNATDAARAAYMNQYVFGNAQFNGASNPAFISGMRQANAFAYANPTFGAYGGALAAQQTYTARSLIMANALGLTPYGTRPTMAQMAQGIYTRTFGNQNITMRGLNASLQQGEPLDVNLRWFGQQMGWSPQTIQEYRNVIQGQVAAQNKGMSANRYYTLLSEASRGQQSAINELTKTTGMGASMFENQRNLNATRLTRQNDILNTLAPAFDAATQAVNKFSGALTALLQNTGLDKLIGGVSGATAPISNALSGFSGAFGAGMGILGASRLFGGGSGGLAGLFGRVFGRGGGMSSGLINATARAGGAYNITSLGSGGSALADAGPYALAGAAVGGAGLMGWKSANPAEAQHQNALMRGINMALETSGPFDPLGAAYLGARGIRRIWDKFQGKNSESWWGLLNPWGSEQRTTNTDGRFGGGSGSTTSSSGNSVANGATASGATAAEVINFAETQLNVPYVWGGEQAGKGFDCSGLTQWAYGKAGVRIPRVAADQQKTGKSVPVNKTQPGDLLFVGNPAHHVVMNIGGGKIIEAPHTGDVVKIRTLNPGEYSSATRILGSIGSSSALGSTSGSVSNSLNNSQNMAGGDIGNFGGTNEASIVASALANSIGYLPLNAGSTSAASVSSAGSPLGSTPKANGHNDKASLMSYAKKLLAKYGWSNEWDSFNALVMSESGWDVHATNPTSGAYGIAQALPASKYASAGADWRTSGDTQLRWMMNYIKGRYGDPDAAWSFHQRNNWYAAGAWRIDKDQVATVHQGEMIIPAKQAETIRQTLVNNTFNPNVAKNAGTGQTIQFGDIHVTMPNNYSGSPQDARLTGKMIMDAVDEQLRIKNLQIGQ